MKLPDGWVFEVELDMKGMEIRVKDRELVKCRNCKHRPVFHEDWDPGFQLEFPDHECPCRCEDDGWYSWMPDDDWWCANGEAKE